VSLGSKTVCRFTPNVDTEKASGENRTERTYAATLIACQQICIFMPICYGVEYRVGLQTGATNCELERQPILYSKIVEDANPYECYNYTKAYTTPSATYLTGVRLSIQMSITNIKIPLPPALLGNVQQVIGSAVANATKATDNTDGNVGLAVDASQVVVDFTQSQSPAVATANMDLRYGAYEFLWHLNKSVATLQTILQNALNAMPNASMMLVNPSLNATIIVNSPNVTVIPVQSSTTNMATTTARNSNSTGTTVVASFAHIGGTMFLNGLMMLLATFCV